MPTRGNTGSRWFSTGKATARSSSPRCRPSGSAVLTYHKYPGEDWPVEEFREVTVPLVSGEQVPMQLAERGTQLRHGLWVRQVRKRSESGKQAAILSTDFVADPMRLAASMFARWSQENFFRYMRQHYGLDRLVEYGTEPIPDTVRVVNPAWRQLDAQVRSLNGQRQRDRATFGARSLAAELSDVAVSGINKVRPRCRSASNIWIGRSNSSKSSASRPRTISPWRSCRKRNAFSGYSRSENISWTLSG